MAYSHRDLFRTLESAINTRQALETELTEQGRRDDPELRSLQESLVAEERKHNDDAVLIEAEDAAERTSILQQQQHAREEARRIHETTIRETVRLLDEEAATLERQHDDSAWVVSSVLDDNSDDSPTRQHDRYLSSLARTRQEQLSAIEAANRKLHELAEARGQRLVTPPAESSDSGSDEDAHAELIQQINAAEERADNLRRLFLPRLFIGWRPVAVLVVLLGVSFLGVFFLLPPSLLNIAKPRFSGEWIGVTAAIAAGISLTMTMILYVLASSAQSEIFGRWQQHVANSRYLNDRWEAIVARELARREPQMQKLQAEFETRREQALERYRETYEARIAHIRGRREALLTAAAAELGQRQTLADEEKARRLAELDDSTARRRAAEEEHSQAIIRELQQQISERMIQRQREQSAIWSTLKTGWDRASGKFLSGVEELNARSREQFASWETLADRATPVATTIPEAIRIGEYRIDLNDWPGAVSTDMRLAPRKSLLELPVVLPFPERPSLLLKSQSPAGRAAALPVLQVALLRLLTLLPPGTVRLTLLDPIGLGDSFAGFMHLADADEQLVTSRIWTEPGQIEARLADLTEHMENVLQTYLRNEFPSLEDYNRHAGEVAEPYRILVVRDFPAKFSEIAARRLTSIITSGPRCGVYTYMSVDGKLQLPNHFQLPDIEAEMNVFEWRERPTSRANAFDWVAADADHVSGEKLSAAPMADAEERRDEAPVPAFYSTEAIFARWPLIADLPPEPDVFSRIVKRWGAESKGARRVEVSFDRIAPERTDRWTLDSRKGIDIPMGRAGAVKLQHVRLGQGTSQHMLIAGKTGSGKSTFLHGLITNLALHYSPDELQFFLIDFKKGVEFKDYAHYRLPHARVIAIESDREFGVSALTRLDEIMQERGELFRRAGAQDVAGYRAALPNSPLPRILLVIDEFQEFFVEDDRYSQTAALLLDRLVRQGRAFGVHVVLGSQTLGGAYSLARSTLGQVAVRVALQCSEADAHLILSEENTAARLLSRPGEAIYNDANGLVEGNHPFQIAWLPDDQRARLLEEMQELARTRGIGIDAPLVFEGNIPSDLSRNEAVLSLIEGDGNGPAPTPSLWLGDAVEIGDPTSIKLERRTSTNALIVGQDIELVQGIFASALLELALQSSAGGGETSESAEAVLWLLDGSSADDPVRELWRKLERVAGPRLRIISPPETADALTSLRAELTLRDDNRHEIRPTVGVFVYNVSRFRDLRKSDDDFGFGGYGADKEAPPSAARQFAELLANGPELGMHTLIWADSFNNVERWFSRQALRDFEYRVLFPMNAADSSNLIDSPLASRLGPGRALLYREDRGTAEKFRPYAIPSEALLDSAAGRFNGTGVIEMAIDLDEFRVL